MSDVTQAEMNPDAEPGESLQEALRGADAGHDEVDEDAVEREAKADPEEDADPDL